MYNNRSSRTCTNWQMLVNTVKSRTSSSATVVVGLLDVGLSKKMQLDPKLKLQLVTKLVRNPEVGK